MKINLIFVVHYSVQNRHKYESDKFIRTEKQFEKYLDLAANEQIIIQRGRNETFVLTKQEYLEPDEDLKRAVTAQQLMPGIVSDIREAYRKRRR